MHLSQAVELNPNSRLAMRGSAMHLHAVGSLNVELEALEQAQRLSPRDPFLAIYAPVVRYMALFALQRYEETIALCRSVTTMNQPCRCLAIDDRVDGIAREDQRSEGSSCAHARPPA